MIVEHDNHALKPQTNALLTAAHQLKGEIDVLVAGYQCDDVISEVEHLPYIRKIYVVDHECYAHALAENMSELIGKIGKAYDFILMPATTFGKNILPRVAALLDVGMVGDVIQIISHDTFLRPMYAGNVNVTVKSQDKIKCLSVRTIAFSATLSDPNKKTSVEKINSIIPNHLSTFKEHALTQSTRPELTNARIIVSGGRGLKSKENVKLLEVLADTLHAALGASRAAVDAGFVSNDYQVGQTGKIVAPDLYMAFGISGAIQHMAGIKDSKMIVAINSDPDAPIFQETDYYLVADLFTTIQEMLLELKKDV